ncbi:hypothetical protein [Pseudooceanicola sp. MF1-13]|uniref:dioxygenase family protein n=1 Tax=Pseudooceanicola sp. MF1-13 TaxID=3379095 RepID=UPI0038921C9A
MSHDDHHDDHDLGFAHDLPRLIGRRRLLTLMGGIGLASASGGAASAMECVALPWETAGPFPADGTNVRAGQVVNALTQAGVIREDLRPSFNGVSGVAQGVPLRMEMVLQNADGCTPLAGHAIYLWHCDAVGAYSLYNLPDQNFLRGVGVADANGVVQFTTIVPGCYPGRWPHFHFEIFASPEAAVNGEASLLTAQIALPEAECAAVYAGDPTYSNGTRNLSRLSLRRDGIFRNNSDAELAQQTLAMRGSVDAGYTGQVTIPVDMFARR